MSSFGDNKALEQGIKQSNPMKFTVQRAGQSGVWSKREVLHKAPCHRAGRCSLVVVL